MSSISGVNGSSNAWAQLNTQRSNHQAKMFAKVDTDGSGSVDQSELDTMLSKISEKTGATFDDTAKVMSSMDSNGDGSLSSDELDSGMKSLMPPPSTMDFAQARSGATDGDGDSDDFAKLDTDGDGSLSKTEFEAGRPQGAGPAGGPPPAGGAQPAGGTSGTSASSSTSYDPLDTNQDGTVSEMERLAGALKELAQTATQKASNGDENQNIIAKLAQKLYDQISSNWLKDSSSSTSTSLNTSA